MRRALRFTLLGIFLFSTVVGVLAGFVSTDWLTRQFIERDIAATNADILGKFHAFDVLLEQEEKLIDRRMETALPLVIGELLLPTPSYATRGREHLADLSRRAGVDNIFIIDKNTVVVATDFTPDLGFELGKISGEMRAFLTGLVGTGRFVADRINMSSKTGVLYKYGYLSPPGSDYIAEVSIDIRSFLARERSQAFVDFLFGSFFRDLVKTHQFLEAIDINMVNPIGRFSLFDPGSQLPRALSDRLQNQDYIIEQSGNLWKVYSRVSPVNSRLSTAHFLAITATYDFTKIADLVRTVMLFLVGTLILASAVAYAVAAKVSARQIVERIESVRRGVSTIAGGDYRHELTVAGNDEINDIAGDINIMRAQIARDMEEKEKAREAAEAASRAKSQFLSSVSHELRTPLNAISGYAQLMQIEEQDAGSTRSRYLARLLKASAQLSRLIDNVLDLSQAEKGVLSLQPRTVAPEPLIAMAVDMIQSHAVSRGIAIDNRVHGRALPNVHADPERLSQVVVNLLSNSVKYCNAGDTISLDAEIGPGDVLRFTVADTGPGIPAEQSGKIFQWFERLGRESGSIDGIGIGLALCHDLVTRMGGRIGFENLTEGCRFWFELPIDRAEAAAEPKTQEPAVLAPAPAPSSPRSVLYVEDSADLIELMRQIFGHLPGTTLLTATDGESGLRLAEARRPDVILMDINLPGMDGITARRRLKANPKTADIPVIAITGAATAEDIERASGAEFFCYITKPFLIGDVKDSINAAWRARG